MKMDVARENHATMVFILLKELQIFAEISRRRSLSKHEQNKFVSLSQKFHTHAVTVAVLSRNLAAPMPTISEEASPGDAATSCSSKT